MNVEEPVKQPKEQWTEPNAIPMAEGKHVEIM